MPHGFDRTLSELNESRFAANVNKPYFELACKLRARCYEGLFEGNPHCMCVIALSVAVHVTCSGGPGVAAFKELCGKLGCKSILIELPKGDVCIRFCAARACANMQHAHQMMTSSYHRGEFQAVQNIAFELTRELARSGFEISRTKIEAMCSSAGVPQTDDEAMTVSASNYFEFHAKLRLNPGVDSSALDQLCVAHEAHLSRNAFKMLDKGIVERFVTQRMYKVGRETALNRFAKCVEDLESLRHVIVLSKQREYTVYDSNVALDRGWIDSANFAANSANKFSIRSS